MRKITIVALVTVLALLGAACGGDDDSGGEDVESTDDGAANDDGGDDGGDDGSGDGGDLSALIGGFGGCGGAAAAIGTMIAAGYSPGMADTLEENSEFFADFADAVPDEIKEDVELLAGRANAYGDVFADYSIADLSDPSKQDEINDAIEQIDEDYPPDDVEAANTAVSEWFAEDCATAVG